MFLEGCYLLEGLGVGSLLGSVGVNDALKDIVSQLQQKIKRRRRDNENGWRVGRIGQGPG